MARRWTPTDIRPEGLSYRPEFLDREEQESLVREIGAVPFHEVRMHGVVAKRMTSHYGWDYDLESFGVRPADPIPDFLLDVRRRAAAEGGIEPEELVEVLLTRYPAGAGIGWHRDAPAFGGTVIGISLLSPCAMKFRRERQDTRLVYSIELAPGSLYVMSGTARWQWQHSIPRTPALRYSITFRTLRQNASRPTSASPG